MKKELYVKVEINFDGKIYVEDIDLEDAQTDIGVLLLVNSNVREKIYLDKKENGEKIELEDIRITEEMMTIDYSSLPTFLQDGDWNVITYFVEQYYSNFYDDIGIFEAAYYLDIPFYEIDRLYYGYYTDDEDFAMDFLSNTGEFSENISKRIYIDWNKTSSELLKDFVKYNNYYFNCNITNQ